MAPPKSGDEILIPIFDAENAGQPLTVKWSQNLSERTAQYYGLTVDNITTGEQARIFIAAEYYKNSTKANPKHVTKFQLVDGEGYQVRLDNNFQYGQKNAEGELRFIVYHDQERKPYQHRFIETALGSAGLGKANVIAEKMGFGAIGDQVGSFAKNFIGDYLHTF
ncbi:hypothetical protein C1H76_0789 [Elsinoe australis]|uniref:Uncharacterized protein n=1 Tax=Elsinoe australis TaxID=40998 RepID=A0A4U7BEJ1_9PEZI|nr:hypothetical protein C1H76_0789 [Elsinoe australis]